MKLDFFILIEMSKIHRHNLLLVAEVHEKKGLASYSIRNMLRFQTPFWLWNGLRTKVHLLIMQEKMECILIGQPASMYAWELLEG